MTDVIVIGGGVIGLSIARELLSSGKDTIVLEKNERAGDVTSSRNSGVIHAGIYYPENFLKTKLCVEGNRLIYEYAKEKKINHKKYGKFIIASNKTELSNLEAIFNQGKKNNVEISRVEKEKVLENNPGLISNLNTNYSTEIDISKISLNPFQPRSAFDKEKLDELVISIKNIGLIQPITIKKISKNKFQLISGERRLRAFKKLKIDKIPCYIRKADDQQSLEMALVENIHRQDLDSIEIAISYKRLIEEIKLTQEELSEKIGKKRSTITNYLRLLKLNPIIQSGIKDGFISMGHGRAMINIDDEKLQLSIYERIISKNLSVRNTEKLISSLKNPVKKKINDDLSNDFLKQKIKTEKKLQTKVDFIFSKNKTGKIILNFKSKSDFLRLIKKINE